MEQEETKEETAQRELEEETGLTAIIDENFEEAIQYIYTDHTIEKWLKTVYFFVGQATHKTVKLSHEHINYKWLPYNQALIQLTYDNGKRLLKKAHKHIISNHEKDL
jgi:8-oxo-dGTP pyrophosphatase MutT (NUDIX family)